MRKIFRALERKSGKSQPFKTKMNSSVLQEIENISKYNVRKGRTALDKDWKPSRKRAEGPAGQGAFFEKGTAPYLTRIPSIRSK